MGEPNAHEQLLRKSFEGRAGGWSVGALACAQRLDTRGRVSYISPPTSLAVPLPWEHRLPACAAQARCLCSRRTKGRAGGLSREQVASGTGFQPVETPGPLSQILIATISN